jgi:protein-tyrosine phosphatase
VMRSVEKLAPFINMGCLTQLTGASLIGQFGKPAQECAQKLIDREWVTVVATDAHNMRHRPPNLDLAYKALSEKYGEAVARRFTIDTPSRVISGNARLSSASVSTRTGASDKSLARH